MEQDILKEIASREAIVIPMDNVQANAPKIPEMARNLMGTEDRKVIALTANFAILEEFALDCVQRAQTVVFQEMEWEIVKAIVQPMKEKYEFVTRIVCALANALETN